MGSPSFSRGGIRGLDDIVRVLLPIFTSAISSTNNKNFDFLSTPLRPSLSFGGASSPRGDRAGPKSRSESFGGVKGGVENEGVM